MRAVRCHSSRSYAATLSVLLMERLPLVRSLSKELLPVLVGDLELFDRDLNCSVTVGGDHHAEVLWLVAEQVDLPVVKLSHRELVI